MREAQTEREEMRDGRRRCRRSSRCAARCEAGPRCARAGRYGALAGEGVAPPGADEAPDVLAGTEEVLEWLFDGIR